MIETEFRWGTTSKLVWGIGAFRLVHLGAVAQTWLQLNIRAPFWVQLQSE